MSTCDIMTLKFRFKIFCFYEKGKIICNEMGIIKRINWEIKPEEKSAVPESKSMFFLHSNTLLVQFCSIEIPYWTCSSHIGQGRSGQDVYVESVGRTRRIFTCTSSIFLTIICKKGFKTPTEPFWHFCKTRFSLVIFMSSLYWDFSDRECWLTTRWQF